VGVWFELICGWDLGTGFMGEIIVIIGELRWIKKGYCDGVMYTRVF
jgi:hypothetical protein